MDGSHRDIFVTSKTVLWPNGLSLDIPAGRLYWVDAFYDRIETILLNGTDRKVGRRAPVCGCPCVHFWTTFLCGEAVCLNVWASVCVRACVLHVCLPVSLRVCPSVCLCAYVLRCSRIRFYQSISVTMHVVCGPDHLCEHLSIHIVCASAWLCTYRQHTLACACTVCPCTGARCLETV